MHKAFVLLGFARPLEVGFVRSCLWTRSAQPNITITSKQEARQNKNHLGRVQQGQHTPVDP